MTPGDPGARTRGDRGVAAAAARALEEVGDGDLVGLGSGHAALLFIALLGERVRAGLRVRGVPTSHASAQAALAAGIPLAGLEELPLDLTVDGADEVAPNLDLVKGWGGALVRERIVAAASSRQVIVVGEEKRVRTLGERGRVPIEVVPSAAGRVTAALAGIGLVPTARLDGTGAPFVTENGNVIVDGAPVRPIADGHAARELQRALVALDGVVDTGLFLGTAERVLVGYADGRVETLLRAQAEWP